MGDLRDEPLVLFVHTTGSSVVQMRVYPRRPSKPGLRGTCPTCRGDGEVANPDCPGFDAPIMCPFCRGTGGRR
jgi:hypothetical protein